MLAVNAKMKKQKEIEKLNAVIAMQEYERNRIAEDMHDEIGPMLSVIKLEINNFVTSQTKDDLMLNVKETSNHLDAVIQNIRDIVRNLSPTNLHAQGLVQSLHEFKTIIEKDSRLRFIFIHEGIYGTFTRQAEANIFRIFHELINNSLKHSNCTEMSVVLRMYEEDFVIFYHDNGRLKEDNKQLTVGMGLRNVESRIRALDGKTHFKSGFENGALYYIIFKNKNLLQPTE